jgi:hypothetical protein
MIPAALDPTALNAIPEALPAPRSSLFHTWPDRLLATLVAAVGLWLVGSLRDVANANQALRESVARLEATVTALQRQVDRLDLPEARHGR